MRFRGYLMLCQKNGIESWIQNVELLESETGLLESETGLLESGTRLLESKVGLLGARSSY